MEDRSWNERRASGVGGVISTVFGLTPLVSRFRALRLATGAVARDDLGARIGEGRC